MSGLSPSPFQRRLAKKLIGLGRGRFSQADVAAIQRAFVAALKEEVESRFPVVASLQRVMMTPNFQTPLVIPGLGSFKMKTRPARTWGKVPGRTPGPPPTTKPSRRLVFTSKWEPIDG